MLKSLQSKPTCKVEMVLKTFPVDAVSHLTIHTHLKSSINNFNSQEFSKYTVCLVHKLLMSVVYYLRNVK